MLSLFDLDVVAETFGVSRDALTFDIDTELVNPDALAEAVLSWCRRVVPQADPLDQHGFAAVIISACGWSDPWSLLDTPRETERQALTILHGLRGRPGDADAPLQLVAIDESGQHAPPVTDLATWTRYVLHRLIQHYFATALSSS
jgi:hypothetical protein